VKERWDQKEPEILFQIIVVTTTKDFNSDE
jgi:hypothetical protein